MRFVFTLRTLPLSLLTLLLCYIHYMLPLLLLLLLLLKTTVTYHCNDWVYHTTTLLLLTGFRECLVSGETAAAITEQ
jgi:hypothetical protein